MSPGPLKPNTSPFSMTKINVTNSIIFVTDSIAMSRIDDMEDDVAADMVMMWLLTWKEADMASDVAGDVATDISNTAHELNGPNSKWA